MSARAYLDRKCVSVVLRAEKTLGPRPTRRAAQRRKGVSDAQRLCSYRKKPVQPKEARILSAQLGFSEETIMRWVGSCLESLSTWDESPHPVTEDLH
jgi:hypothetical protein